MTWDELCSFCGDWGKIEHPWLRNGFVYASDGRIMVRVPASDIGWKDKKPSDNAPDESVFLWNHDEVKDWGAIPKTEKPLRDCDCCQGSGHASLCTKCEGDGTVECPECGHSSTCEECGGTGRTMTDSADRCIECNGTGKEADPKPTTDIGTRWFANWLLAKASILSNAEVEMTGEEKSAARIRFDGGVGYLMSVTKGF